MYRAVMTTKPLIPSFCLLPLAAMASACGGGDASDPTPDVEDAASGTAVNAAVTRAEQEAAVANELAPVRGAEAAERDREALANEAQ